MTDAIHRCGHCGEEIKPGTIGEHLPDNCDNVVYIDGTPFPADKMGEMVSENNDEQASLGEYA